MADQFVVDVLVVGAGPVGLITAYQLARFGGISVVIIEKHDKSAQDAYGRAITLYPRSSEMLAQLGLADELAQQCFACRETVAYDSNGKEVEGRGWNFMRNMKDTAWDFALVLRQKYQEEIFRGAMRKHGLDVQARVELKEIAIDERVPIGEHRITANVFDGQRGQPNSFRCKYLIGCDGGRSSVRRMLSIPFEGSTTEDRWVRIDGMIKTDLPKPRSYCAIESPTHGNVLWAALDRGATRIGYAFTADRANKYETFDETAAVKEAIEAAKPFSLEFEQVDWWTIYSVGQRIAKSFFVHDCVFLAGDSCHTHSSGAAQGMNTGLHDSVNLGWKLNLVLKGMADPEILKTYQSERLPNVQRLINYDKDISRLMTGRLPEGWKGDPNVDLNIVLGQIMEEAGSFSSGLGIFYDIEVSNPLSIEGSFKSETGFSSVRPGKRAPDGTLLLPGTFRPTSLIAQTPNNGNFYLLVLVGNPRSTSELAFHEKATRSAQLKRLIDRKHLACLSVIATKAPSAYESLRHEPLGQVYYDDENQGLHKRYDVQVDKGAVVVLRPDGWVGTMTEMDSTAIPELESYFEGVFI